MTLVSYCRASHSVPASSARRIDALRAAHTLAGSGLRPSRSVMSPEGFHCVQASFVAGSPAPRIEALRAARALAGSGLRPSRSVISPEGFHFVDGSAVDGLGVDRAAALRGGRGWACAGDALAGWGPRTKALGATATVAGGTGAPPAPILRRGRS